MLKRQSACNQFQRIGIKTITKSGLTQLNQAVRLILYLLLINLGSTELIFSERLKIIDFP
jgi:hypothetical protein